MCGIFGVANIDVAGHAGHLRSCLEVLQHRGPDGIGDWKSESVYLGHNRLSIIDLSEAGRQPMSSGQVVICVNGEIYNYPELKKLLEKKYQFKSGSDSEVILHGFMEWGVEGLLSRLEGMYAFSVYDIDNQKIYLVRDRSGIKPLYYSSIDGQLGWASELKALESFYNLGDNNVDPESILDFYTYKYIPAPKTLYRQVQKLLPAHYLEYDLPTKQIEIKKYWDISFSESSDDYQTAKDKLSGMISRAAKMQLLSDAPVGAFLSGGIDSSLLLSMLSRTGHRIPTFSIIFNNPKYDESLRINSIVDHLGLENTQLKLEGRQAGENFKRMRRWFDEPFGDFSSLATYELCSLASSSVKVAISGDGADELFGGYKRYLAQVDLDSSKKYDRFDVFKYFKALFGWTVPGRLVRYLESKLLSGLDLYCFLTGGLLPNESMAIAKRLGVSSDYDLYWHFKEYLIPELSPLKRMQYMDFKGAMPDTILTKVDRLSMSTSLEVRVPYLDTSVVEYAFSMPDKWLVSGHETKMILRDMASDFLPRSIYTAGKKGFGVPPELRLNSSGKRCWGQDKILSELYIDLETVRRLYNG
ncbi:asparagine synthase (glutamine-hydrolyzing) [Hahella ganghwensis]|uniref:asparagine synthase (glutamine-hydrolyzing) n=1 Tax=Hahella ganghwensis TaxID=286420 RepID=UPI00036ED5B9|nr:asparagine synthase (glutamine-hydrolyzing) [Hahella ganghwensis]